MSYSTLILTRNESHNIERCLMALAGCDDIVVLDSLSSDDTCSIAERLGARVVSRPFDTFADQRNWAIDHIPFRYHWVLHLDADECLTPKLDAEIKAAVAGDTLSAFLIANKLIFMGRWIPRSSMYPHYQARLLKLGEARFAQHGHGQVLANATRGIGRLREPYLHYNFSRGLSDWVERHNRYSTQEARRIAASRERLSANVTAAVTAPTAESRQQALKRVADAMPLRPLVRFFYLYILRGGFLDGRAGLDYSILMSFYDYLTRLKVRELRCTTTSPQSAESPPADGVRV